MNNFSDMSRVMENSYTMELTDIDMDDDDSINKDKTILKMLNICDK